MMQNRLALSAYCLFVVVGFSTTRALTSSEIPRGSSKTSPDAAACGLPEHKLTLTECTDPLAPNVPDHRGNWTDQAGSGHWQYIEQCADRYTVSGPASEDYYIHDFLAANGTAEGGVLDYNAAVFPECEDLPRPVGVFEGECMNMMVGPIAAATRCLLEDGSLFFTNLMLGNMTLTRVDDAGEEQAEPQPDGLSGTDPDSGAVTFATRRMALMTCLVTAALFS